MIFSRARCSLFIPELSQTNLLYCVSVVAIQVATSQRLG
jgi:hypothetical protein